MAPFKGRNIRSNSIRNTKEKSNASSETYPEKVYSLLGIFVKYVGGYHRKRRSAGIKPDASANLKFMNWLLSKPQDYSNYEQEKCDRSLMKHKLRFLIPHLQKCNGDVNFIDERGQSILMVFIAKYIPSYQSLQKDDVHRALADVVTKLLREGASTNLADFEGNTALHIALKQQADASIVKLLLESFVAVNACDRDDNSVLHILLKSNKSLQQMHAENMKILIAKNIEIHRPNKQGSTAVHLAVERCNVEALQIFESQISNFGSIEKCDGRKLLHIACDDVREKSSDQARESMIDFLTEHKCDINEVDRDGCTALHYAAKHCSSRIIVKLIELGADVSRRTKKYGYTALHLAGRLGRLDAIKALIDAGVKVDIVAKGGLTPLHLAILYSEWSVGTETIRFLLQNGANVNRRETVFDLAPLHLAAFAGESIVNFLARNREVDVNIMSVKGVTPLHLAAILGNVEMVKILLDRGANFQRRDRILNSNALHWASRRGEILNVNSLVIDVDVYLKDKEAMKEFWSTMFVKRHKSFFHLHELIHVRGNAVLREPTIQSDNAVIDILLRSDAFVNARDCNGHSSLYYVLKSNNVEGLQSLLEFGGNVNDVEIEKLFEEKKFDHKVMKREGLEKGKIEFIKEMYNNKENDTTKERKKREMIEKRRINEELLIILLKHLIKLKVVNLSIFSYYESDLDERALEQFPNHKALLVYLVTCKEEVEQLKNHTVDGHLSFYNLLHMDINERYKFAYRIAILNLKAKFPEYYNVIRNSCREAIDRIYLLSYAKTALNRISKCHLPDQCVEPILFCLDNESLRTLADVACIFE